MMMMLFMMYGSMYGMKHTHVEYSRIEWWSDGIEQF